jgi:transcriptional regulator with XRE-family HTH domain
MSDGTRHRNQPLDELVRARRKDLGLTERELVRRCGWPDDYGLDDVRSLEAGELRFPSTTQLKDLARALELDSEVLEEAISTSLHASAHARPHASATVHLKEGRRLYYTPPEGIGDEESLRAWARTLSVAHDRPVTLRIDGAATVEISPDHGSQ